MDTEELIESDRKVLDVLSEGRATPRFLVEESGLSKQTVHNRLNVLAAAGHVQKISKGLYELVDDPRDDAPEVHGNVETSLDESEPVETVSTTDSESEPDDDD